MDLLPLILSGKGSLIPKIQHKFPFLNKASLVDSLQRGPPTIPLAYKAYKVDYATSHIKDGQFNALLLNLCWH